jgi:hypothetical protein
MVTFVTAPAAVAPIAVQFAAPIATVAAEVTFSGACAAAAAGWGALSEAALVSAVALESAATGFAAANVWNPVGWAVGVAVVGASQEDSGSVTWDCYRPIIGEAGNQELPVKQMTLADLAAHPEVRWVAVGAKLASANVPDVEVENKAGHRYLLRGVALPWGSAAYHAERLDNQSQPDPIIDIPTEIRDPGDLKGQLTSPEQNHHQKANDQSGSSLHDD